MANVLRLIGCCFLSMLFVLELFAWLVGFGINLPLFIVCSIGLIVLLVYTTYDILTIKEDNAFLQDRCKNLERMYTDAIRNSQEGNRAGCQDKESRGVFNGEGI